jgi:hypothetical protein
VAWTMASESLLSTVVAPRIPLQYMVSSCGDTEVENIHRRRQFARFHGFRTTVGC